MGRGEKLTRRVHEIEIAKLVNKFGAVALLPGIDFFALMQAAEIGAIIDLYQVVGTDRQKGLSAGQWRFIKWLDDVAREEDAKS